MSDREVDESRERAYRDFMNPTELPPAAEMREAEARLGKALERELGVSFDAGARLEVARTRRFPVRGLALAAGVVIALVGVAVGTRWGQRSEESQVRGTGPAPAGDWAAAPQVDLHDPDRVAFSWKPAPGAESYVVVFSGTDFNELSREPGLTEPRLTLRRSDLPRGVVPGKPALWRVIALRGSDEIARSALVPLEIP